MVFEFVQLEQKTNSETILRRTRGPQMKNIILLMTDTFRYDNLGDKAERPVRTPEIDRFGAERATSIERFYIGSSPMISLLYFERLRLIMTPYLKAVKSASKLLPAHS